MPWDLQRLTIDEVAMFMVSLKQERKQSEKMRREAKQRRR